MIKDLTDLLVLHEGYRQYPYRCTAGKLTIGVGFNLDDTGLFLDEAEAVLQLRLQRLGRELAVRLPWITNLDPVRLAVLMDMAYNLGVPGLLKFKNTLADVQAGRYTSASRKMLASLWSRQVGQRSVRLATMMDTGQWPQEN